MEGEFNVQSFLSTLQCNNMSLEEFIDECGKQYFENYFELYHGKNSWKTKLDICLRIYYYITKDCLEWIDKKCEEDKCMYENKEYCECYTIPKKCEQEDENCMDCPEHCQVLNYDRYHEDLKLAELNKIIEMTQKEIDEIGEKRNKKENEVDSGYLFCGPGTKLDSRLDTNSE
jgi:hypothetical protein